MSYQNSLLKAVTFCCAESSRASKNRVVHHIFQPPPPAVKPPRNQTRISFTLRYVSLWRKEERMWKRQRVHVTSSDGQPSFYDNAYSTVPFRHDAFFSTCPISIHTLTRFLWVLRAPVHRYCPFQLQTTRPRRRVYKSTWLFAKVHPGRTCTTWT